MTDKEIIQAWECHISRSLDDCKQCPYKDLKVKGCQEKLYEDITDLIKRQQAEIDKLERKIKEQNEIIANSNFAEFYIHKHSIENIEGYTADIYKRAIREFTERLKAKSSIGVASDNGQEIYSTKMYSIMAYSLDDIVAEMVGERNAEI